MNCSSQHNHQQLFPPPNQSLQQGAPQGQQAPQQARRVFLFMLGLEGMLAAFYWLDILSGSPVPVLHALVDLDGEGNLPAWFSSLQLAMISLCLGYLAYRQRPTDKPSRGFLALLAAVFLLWSADETAQLHERLTGWIGLRYVDWLPGFLYEHKLMVMVLIVVLSAIARLLWADVLAFWRAHRQASRMAILGFCVVFLGGAVLETIGYKFFLDGTTPLLYQTEVCFEEVFEMLGASMILYSTSLLALSKAEAVEKTKPEAVLQPLILESNPIL
jgi:hypothetical protein